MIMAEKPLKTDMKRILIAEDNAFFLQFLKQTMHLRFPSIDTLEAANGEEAMHKIKTLSPEAIFMDLRLPGENGLELTAKIKAKHPDVIVIILTSYDTPEYREAAVQVKADRFLSKGSSSKEGILALVESILAGR